MPRRVPVPSLRPPLELCKATGVSLGSRSRVVIAGDEGGVAGAPATLLEDRGASVLSLDGAAATDAVTSRLAAWLKEGPVEGVFWLPALDVEPGLAEMDLATFREANRRRVKNLHAAMRSLYESVALPGTFLVSATRMGGLHGGMVKILSYDYLVIAMGGTTNFFGNRQIEKHAFTIKTI